MGNYLIGSFSLMTNSIIYIRDIDTAIVFLMLNGIVQCILLFL